ncbi:hypothetical protein WJU16_02815 [Chitinophaga pollutisoli]|uniref:Lipoprotein n=1 Tax=Chitinophaga pollutisoli TaxID=3133966 RepID=A0ABZ2YSP8_9BACT
MQKIKLTITALALASAFTACQSIGSDAKVADITGNYHRVDSSQFSILHQQVQIAPVGGSSRDKYHVKVLSITDFHSERPNDTTEKSTNATFDPKSGLLTTDRSLVYHYDPASGNLVVKGQKGEVIYQKQ